MAKGHRYAARIFVLKSTFSAFVAALAVFDPIILAEWMPTPDGRSMERSVLITVENRCRKTATLYRQLDAIILRRQLNTLIEDTRRCDSSFYVTFWASSYYDGFRPTSISILRAPD